MQYPGGFSAQGYVFGSPNVGRLSFVAMVVEAVLDGSEGRGPNEEDRQDFEERAAGSGCLAVGSLV